MEPVLSDDELVDRLYALCFGKREPTARLMNQGRFPDGWDDAYSELFDEAKRRWEVADLVPFRLFAVLHFVSVYLWNRYDLWRSTSRPGGNPETEKQLARLSGSAELLIMSRTARAIAEEGARLAAEGTLSESRLNRRNPENE